MADELESVLRNSLDAVDRGRRWAILGVVALFVAMLIAAATLAATAAGAAPRGAPPGPFKALFMSTVTEMLFVGCCTIVLMLHVSRLAKAILRAIELRRGE